MRSGLPSAAAKALLRMFPISNSGQVVLAEARLTRVADASWATWSLEHDAVGHVTAGVDPTWVRREARIGTAGFGESLTDGAAT